MSNMNALALSALDALSAHIAVLDEQGTIVTVNRAWREFAEANVARTNVNEGANYLQVCDQTRGAEAHYAHDFAAGIRAVLKGEKPIFTLEYPCHSATQHRWFIERVTRFFDNGAVYAVVAHENITERKITELNLRAKNEIIETVNNAGQLLNAELDQQRLVQSITDAATKLAGAEFGAFFYNVTNEDGEIYSLYTLSGAPLEAFSGFPMPRNTAIFGPTFRGESIVRSNDITKDPDYGKNAPYKGMPEGHLPVRSYLAVPVISRSGEVLGGLFFGHSKIAMFSEFEESLIAALAAQAAVSLDNARLYAEVEKERERFSTTLLSIGDGVIVTDQMGRVVFLNPVAEKLTGWPTSEAVRRHLPQVFHIINEDTRQTVENPVDKVMRLGSVVGLANHTVLVTRDGSEIPIDDSGAPIRDSEGRISGVVLVFRDVSERKHIEATQARLAAIIESSDDAIVSKTLEGIVTSWNAGAERIFGYTADEIIGKHITTLFPPERINEEEEILQKIGRGERVAHFETIRVHKSGRPIPISVTISPVKDSSGRIIGASKIAQDVSERKQAEIRDKQLVALNERQRLARDLHDAVSQSLFSANVIAESLPRLHEINPERTFGQLQQLHRLTRGAVAEMRTLLFELRPENLINTSLELLMTQLVHALQARKHIEASVILKGRNDKSLPEEVHVAVYRIAQEALNNIAKHAQASHIRVRLTRRPAYVKLDIVDNGNGFDTHAISSGFGLISMRERAASIGASVHIQSKKGVGSKISMVWS